MNLNFKQSTNLPLILQEERAECGHACIAMIANYLGHELDIYALRKISPPSCYGVNLLDLYKLAERLSLSPRAISIASNELKFVQSPAILHWAGSHFVVLKKVKKNYIIVHDPALGVRKCSMKEVASSFTGAVLEIKRAITFEKLSDKKVLGVFDLIKTISGFTKVVLSLLLISLSLEIISLLNPLFMQYLTDSILSTSSSQNLGLVAIIFIFLACLHFLIEYFRSGMVIYISHNLTEQFSSNVLAHLLKLPLEFFTKRHKGDIQSKFQSIEYIQKKLSSDLISTFIDGLIILVNIVVMFIYSGLLTSIVLFGLCIYLIIRYLSYYSLSKQTQISIHQHAKTSSIFLETLQAILPIKAFLKEGTRFTNWRNSNVISVNADIKISQLNGIYSAFNLWVLHVEHIVVLCTGASLVLANKFSLGMLMAFLSYRLLLVNKCSSFFQHIFEYKLLRIQLKRLSDILFQKPEVLPEGPGSFKDIKGKLTLKNIDFRYQTNSPYVLRNINFELNPGEKVAIIGSSGTGKSTLLKVALGLLSRTAGEILIDDISVEEFGLKNYRELTASVMQEDCLLSGSILSNIAFFDEDLDLAKAHQAAKLASIHDFILTLPMGYETILGDLGTNLSGGQKQRILLARALYKKPKILFLDEATSHLDNLAEKQISLALKSLNITQFIIAHRQETIAMADRVINLETLQVGY